MKKIILVLFAVVLMVTAAAVPVFADEVQAVSEPADVDGNGDSAEKDDMNVELDFQADGFLRNLKYMGLGMLGIFVVVGVVILITFGLNAATTKKK